MTAQVDKNGRRLALGAAATAAHWIGAEALFALGDGAVLIAAREGAPRRFQVHDGAILCATHHPDRARLLTGGDDGRLNAVAPSGAAEQLFENRKWIEHIAASSASGVIAAAAGKDAVILRGGRETHRFAHPSTVAGLALDARGSRLAVSHYGGATVRYALMADDKGVELKWAGSHLGVTMSPNADYVITAMQENALHGWRLPEKTDLRMDGYPAKTRSFSWDKRGRWLATSGAESAIVWPFAGKLGPQGKAPLQPGQREALVTAVAFHPSDEVLAIGYADGAALIVRFADQLSLDLVAPSGGPVTALAWDDAGKHIAIGDDAGHGAIVGV